jgi:predicted O-linked N-acetylglucosamine transferase (SPINDLY family)
VSADITTSGSPENDPDLVCAAAMRLQLAGDLDQADGLYRSILLVHPRHAAANYCAGMLSIQRRRPAEALPHLLAALEAKPDTVDYWLGVLEALLQTGRIEEARSTLALARQHGLAGQPVEDFARRLAERSAPEPDANAAASAPPRPSRAQRRSEAHAFRKQEKSVLSLIEHRKFPEAHALALGMTERFPEHGFGWKVLGAFVSAQGRFEDALDPMRHAVRLLPGDAEAHVNLGMNLFRLDRFDEAEAELKHAIALDPTLTSAHFRLGMVYGLRNRYAEAEECLRRGFALNSDYVPGDLELSFSNLLFLASHNPAVQADELFAMHRRAGDHLEAKLRKSWPRHANVKDPDRVIKVGFVSGDLHHHAVAFFIDPVLGYLAKQSSLELHAYYNNTIEDSVNQRLRGYFRHWHTVAQLDAPTMAKGIAEDGIDILVDLSGHSGANRLPVFARKPAPIQVSWIGYPGTTGLRAMDYYLADRHFLPPGQFDRYFTEKIVYLPANVPFQPFQSAPPVNDLPALASGALCFASFNRMGKINPATVEMWSGLLSAVPNARMLIGAVDGSGQSLIDQFAAFGIESARLTLHPRCGMEEYLRLHHQVDICLDTYPYTGGTTTIQALWMGVPTLTIAGLTPGSRQGAAILGQLGLDQFVASDGADLAAKGRHWAEHLRELAALRAGLRDRWQRSPARQPELIAAALERGLRRMWARWCAGLAPESWEIG